MIEINRNPSRRDLLAFGAGLAVVFAVIGALRWHAGFHATAAVWWVTGLALTVMFFAVPRIRRWLYLAWIYAMFPVAWAVSYALLGIAYFLVATPIAITLHLIGRDPLQRRFDRAARSYWVLRTPNRDDARYFRQF